MMLMAKPESSLQDITNSTGITNELQTENNMGINTVTGSNENSPGLVPSTSVSWPCETLPLDTGAVCTRVLVPGDPNAGKNKLPCPVPGCQEKLFPARDMYYLKRHFSHDHSITHPNPVFITVCPLEQCRQDCGQTIEGLRKHLMFAHPDAYCNLTPGRFIQQ